VTFAEFEALAERDWERIPDTFKEGIDALVIVRDARAHDRSPGIFTLGECVTESWPSDFGGPETIRSELILYYGSFRRLAAQDEDFDWEEETWETITHELKHHLESLAAEDDLEDVDAAMEQHFRRHDGEPFDPFYFRGGEPLGDGWYRLEDAFFYETEESGTDITFAWDGSTYRIVEPIEGPADVNFITVDGVDSPPGELCIVIVRGKSLRSRLGALLRREQATVVEGSARAERLKDGG
jgi:predicted Zn-dependent protease with MMP-like domain